MKKVYEIKFENVCMYHEINRYYVRAENEAEALRKFIKHLKRTYGNWYEEIISIVDCLEMFEEKKKMKKVTIKKKLRDLTKEEAINYFKNCGSLECAECTLKNVKCTVNNEFFWYKHKEMFSDKFLDQEIEIEVEKKEVKLTEDEKVILRNLPEKYKYIARDKINDDLYLFESKPFKQENIWFGQNSFVKKIDIYNHLFQFIKWEDKEPYLIEDLLKNG